MGKKKATAKKKAASRKKTSSQQRVRTGRPPGTVNLDPPETYFGCRIFEWWLDTGWTQKECAEYLGVGLRSFQRWLHDVQPNPQTQRVIQSLIPEAFDGRKKKRKKKKKQQRRSR